MNATKCNIKKYYEARFLFCEWLIAALIAIVIIFILNHVCGSEDVIKFLNGSRQQLYAMLASISGTILGFIIATVSILMGLLQLPKLKLVRISQHHRTVYAILFSTIRYLSYFTIWAIVAFIFDKDTAPKIWLTYIGVWLLIIVSIRFYRCLWVIQKTVNIAAGNSGAKENKTDESESAPRPVQQVQE